MVFGLGSQLAEREEEIIAIRLDRIKGLEIILMELQKWASIFIRKTAIQTQREINLRHQRQIFKG